MFLCRSPLSIEDAPKRSPIPIVHSCVSEEGTDRSKRRIMVRAALSGTCCLTWLKPHLWHIWLEHCFTPEGLLTCPFCAISRFRMQFGLLHCKGGLSAPCQTAGSQPKPQHGPRSRTNADGMGKVRAYYSILLRFNVLYVAASLASWWNVADAPALIQHRPPLAWCHELPRSMRYPQTPTSAMALSTAHPTPWRLTSSQTS